MPRKQNYDLLTAIGQRVAQARKERGWTQEQLAEAIAVEPLSRALPVHLGGHLGSPQGELGNAPRCEAETSKIQT